MWENYQDHCITWALDAQEGVSEVKDDHEKDIRVLKGTLEKYLIEEGFLKYPDVSIDVNPMDMKKLNAYARRKNTLLDNILWWNLVDKDRKLDVFMNKPLIKTLLVSYREIEAKNKSELERIEKKAVDDLTSCMTEVDNKTKKNS